MISQVDDPDSTPRRPSVFSISNKSYNGDSPKSNTNFIEY